MKSFFVAIGQSYLHDLAFTHVFKKTELLWGEIVCQRASSRFSFFYRTSNDKNFNPKYLDNAFTDFVLTSRTSRRLLEEKVPVNYFL